MSQVTRDGAGNDPFHAAAPTQLQVCGLFLLTILAGCPSKTELPLTILEAQCGETIQVKPEELLQQKGIVEKKERF